MWNTTSSKPMPRSFLSFAFFASSPGEALHSLQGITSVCSQGTDWHRRECARQYARAGSDTLHPAPNAPVTR
jgi:hypothetical protein